MVKSNVRLFADDTAMYLAISSLSEASNLQDDFIQLEKWEKSWDMDFNPTKCQVLHITRSKTPIPSVHTSKQNTWKCLRSKVPHGHYLRWPQLGYPH